MSRLDELQNWWWWTEYDKNPQFIKIRLMKGIIKNLWPDIRFDSLSVREVPPGTTEWKMPLAQEWAMDDGAVPNYADFHHEVIKLQPIRTYDEGGYLWLGYGPQSNILVFR